MTDPRATPEYVGDLHTKQRNLDDTHKHTATYAKRMCTQDRADDTPYRQAHLLKQAALFVGQITQDTHNL